MGQVYWTEPALDDVRDILNYVSRDSPAYAARLGRRITEAPRHLSTFPRLGSIVPELASDMIRELWVRPYRIMYQVRGEACFILAVVHGSRDLSDYSLTEPPTDK